jgi:hypothetical protein
MKTTYQEPILRIFDNPLLIAQAQRQLRKKQLTMSLFIAGALSIVVLLVCFQIAQNSSGFVKSDGMRRVWLGGQQVLYFMLFFSLYWRGASGLVQSISEERKSGIFTFLRSTPLSPYSLTLGYLFGVNIRGYCVSGVIAPFWIGCSVAAGISLTNAILSYLFILLGAFTMHTLVLAFVLHTSSGKTQKWGSLVFVLGLCFMAIPFDVMGLHTLSHLTPIPALSSFAGDARIFELSPIPVPLFGLKLRPELFTLLVQSVMISTSIWISARRMERDNQAVMSRRGALIVMFVIAILIIGCDLNPINRKYLTQVNNTVIFGILTQFVCLIFACYIAFISAPSRLSFIRATRRRSESSSSSRVSIFVPWHSEGGSLLPFSLILIIMNTGIVSLFFLIYGEESTSLFALLTHPDFLVMIFSSSLFLMFFSGVCEYIKSNAHQLSQSLAIVTTLVVFFLLPLILALIFQEPRIYVVSPIYTLMYGLASFGWSMHDFIHNAVSKEVVNLSYNIISVIITGGVATMAYLRSSAIRSKSLEQQSVGDGN